MTLHEQFKEEFKRRSIIAFLEDERITNDQGQILDFKDHRFLLDIYRDFTPKQAIRKAAQIGFSTTANIKALWLCKNKGLDIIYSLPTANDVHEFVAGKTNRLIANNPVLQQWTADKDSIESKRVGNNQIYFRGTWTERAALMIPADLYISDETDRSKQEVVKQYASRLQHSKYAWQWYFSNPSAPNKGVDFYWQQSDQKHWFIKCEGCNHWDYITMDNVREEAVVCIKCGKELNRRNGQWVKRWQDRDISGYWIPLIICPWVSAKEILKKQRDEYSEEQFANYVMGEPYVGKGNVLTEMLLLQNLTPAINPQDSTPIIGVDNGSKITYVIGNRNGLFYNGEATDFSEIEGLMLKFPTAVMCVDPHGNETWTLKLQQRFPSRVWRAYFISPRKNDMMAKWKPEDQTVLIDRDRVIQLIVDEFIEKRVPLQGTQEDWWNYWIQWSHLQRTTDENNLGVETFHWEKDGNGRCDFPFATVYWRVLMDRFWADKATFNDPRISTFYTPGYEITASMTTLFQPKVRL